MEGQMGLSFRHQQGSGVESSVEQTLGRPFWRQLGHGLSVRDLRTPDAAVGKSIVGAHGLKTLVEAGHLRQIAGRSGWSTLGSLRSRHPPAHGCPAFMRNDEKSILTVVHGDGDADRIRSQRCEE